MSLQRTLLALAIGLAVVPAHAKKGGEWFGLECGDTSPLWGPRHVAARESAVVPAHSK